MRAQSKPKTLRQPGKGGADNAGQTKPPLVASGLLVGAYGVILLLIGAVIAAFSSGGSEPGGSDYTTAAVFLTAGLNFLVQGVLLAQTKGSLALRAGSKLALAIVQTPIAVFVFGLLGVGNLFTRFLPGNGTLIAFGASLAVGVVASLWLWALLLLGASEDRSKDAIQ